MRIPQTTFTMTREERKVLADFYEAMLDKQFFDWSTDDVCDFLDSIRNWDRTLGEQRTYKTVTGVTLELEK